MPRYAPAAVLVPNSGLTDVATLEIDYLETLGVQVTVAGNALADFSILGRFHDSGAWVTLYTAAADFTSPSGLMVEASGDITTQGVGTGFFIMKLDGLEAVKLQAQSSNASGSTVTILANAK